MTDAHQAQPEGQHRSRPALVIGGASLGTVFEWYDFFVYASVASIIASHFFSGFNEATSYIFALLAFAVGFAVRPLGGLLFGAIGDRLGRKRTFVFTMLLMGVATMAIGFIPVKADIGMLAPILLIVARLLQGLAMGGEYGGAAIYVAEHASPGRRGLWTSFIQITATLGLILSLMVTLAVRTMVGEEAFVEWGWRIPFLLSAFLLIASVWIRLSLSESPEFEAAFKSGSLTTRPIAEALGDRRSLGRIFLALFGLCAGMTVIWYTSQFYTLFFMERTLRLDGPTANTLLTIALLLASPFFIFFGWLSDKIGGKWIVLSGCLLAALTFQPLFHSLASAINPALAAATQRSPVTVSAAPESCSFQFDPVGRSSFLSSCDIAKAELARAGISYQVRALGPGSPAQVEVGSVRIASFEGGGLDAQALAARRQVFATSLTAALRQAGYPARANPGEVNHVGAVAILFVLILFATMCYGPLAATLSEMFPVRVRYTSVSVAYNIATGWIGGFLPAAAFAIVARTGDIYAGLWYPIAFAMITFVVGALFLPKAGRFEHAGR